MFSEQNFIIFSCFFVIVIILFFALDYIIDKNKLTKTITGIHFRLFLFIFVSIMSAFYFLWFFNYLKSLEQQLNNDRYANWLFPIPLTFVFFGALNSTSIFDISINRVTGVYKNENEIWNFIYGILSSLLFLIGLILFAIPVFWP